MSDQKKRKRSPTSRSSSDVSGTSDSSQKTEDGPAGPSCLSVKSDRSRIPPMNFRADKSECLDVGQEASSSSQRNDVLRDSVCQLDSPADHLLQEDRGNTFILGIKNNLKKEMQQKFAVTSEGNGDQQSLLQSIYTSLYITTGETEAPGGEHEYTHLEYKLKDPSLSDSSVSLDDIYKMMSDQEKPQRTVLMKGVAGIGKSFAVQKFSLDWAKEETNQEVDFVFSLAFRELNLSEGEKSFHELLTEFHAALQPLKDSEVYAKTKIIVILDGLDESRLHLDFKTTKPVRSLRDRTSVANLLVNLIQGNLLPDANIWITSRPAAASQIPAECIAMVTEIRGFTDAQKVEYFRRRFSEDQSLADRITEHIQSSQSLDIMCQIPIFCWMSAILFQEVFGGEEETKLPQTLTEMMAHFLFVQTKRRSRKYDKKTEKNQEKLLENQREFLLKLGKLAFVHLQENKLIFYEEDLADCGIDVEEASVYSGFFNTVLREERVFNQTKIFFFVHLTIQEFFAALYVYECFTTKKTKELENFLHLEDKDYAVLDLVKMTVEKVLEKKNGHLDFFLQFLLGLMVEPNHRVLLRLLTALDPKEETDKKTLTFLRSIRRKTLSPDSCINLFRIMVEMGDHRVKDEIQEYLQLSDRSKTELSPLHCSALAYMLLVSKEELEELDLKSYNTTDEGRRRLIPAVRSSIKALLSNCRVTAESVEYLAFALKFSYSALRDLDLSNNDLEDSGVKLLCGGLSSPCCKLEKLRLSGCLVTETGCTHLVSALQSNPSHLMELDLSYNHPGDSGGKLLSGLKDDPQYKLSKLNLDQCGSHRIKSGFRKYAFELSLNPKTTQKNLVLSEGNRKVAWVEEDQPHPRHTGGPGHQQLVLCGPSLTGRHYWEVEMSGSLSIGVTSEGADVKGNTCDVRMGHGQGSWCLVCSDSGFYVLHHSSRVDVSAHGWRGSRVGVYLDRAAGALSFYRVSSDVQTHLHTYQILCSEPLYPAVELRSQSSAVLHRLM